MKYRWLDLRREHMQRNIRVRAQLVRIIREEMEREGFVDIETPMLWKPTPEGARDFVVPSRLQPGKFYALPQSPQIAKQLLVISGFERYYQIARCLRDEDPRADRLQELTQLDVEMAFPDREFIFALMERIAVRIWGECIGVDLPAPFARMTYDEAMLRFGIDRPDLRFGLEIQEATEATRGSEFGVFANAPCVRYIAVPKELSRTEVQALENQAKSWGAKGLAYLVFRADGEIGSPIAKFLSDDLLERWRQPGHTLLFVADEPGVVAKVLGLLRLQLGRELELVDESLWKFLWIVDMPSAEWDEQNGRWIAAHHPFTRPTDDSIEIFKTDPGAARAVAYDLVANGIELAGGSFRIHEPWLQQQVFDQPRHRRGGAAREVRLPARRAGDGRAAARRHRVRHRPPDDGAAERAVHPRHAGVPEEPGRLRLHDRGADRAERRTARRARTARRRRSGRHVSSRLAIRLLGLVGVALAAGVVALAVVRDRDDSNASPLPAAAPAPGGGWFEALAVPARAPAKPRATACGFRLTAKTLGVAHPVLPCGVQVYLELGDHRVLTRVIGRGSGARSEFALTRALADELGLHNRQQIRWRSQSPRASATTLRVCAPDPVRVAAFKREPTPR